MKKLSCLMGMLLLLFVSCNSENDTIKINGKTTIYISSEEPAPLINAVGDLANDMEKVFGIPFKIVNRLEDCNENTIVVTLKKNIPNQIPKIEGWEKLMIKVIKNPFQDSSIENAVFLTGSDMRGAIYAVYEFSEKFLHVDPLYWWNDNEPERMQMVEIPIDYQEIHKSPTIKYRGLFINDEDLLSGWKSGTGNFDGISDEAWDRIFEVILRMKGNMITPGTFIFPYEPQVKAASKRGLIITQHHVEVLGLNTFRWPEEVPYSFLIHKEKLLSAWTKTVEQYPKDMEILWTVGYRGKRDRAFWEDDNNSPKSKQARADIISDAITAQINIVKKRFDNPYFIMNTWGEGIEMVRESYLHLPTEVTLVWADKGWGIIRDEGKIEEGQGIYYHTAMFNQKCNQLSEMIPLKRIQREIGRAVKANATEYLLINCSDLRPVLMSTKAAMSIGWDSSNWIQNDNFHNTFLRDWCVAQFGEENAEKVEKIYKRYYETPIQYSDKEFEKFGDNFYHHLTRTYLVRMTSQDNEDFIRILGVSNEQLKDNAKLWAKLSGEANQHWARLFTDAQNLYNEIPRDRQGFYQAHILMPIILHKNSNMILHKTMNAYFAKSPKAQYEQIESALNEFPPIFNAFEKAEYGKWQDFYLNDLMTAVKATRKCLQIAKKVINGEPNYEDLLDYYTVKNGRWEMIKAYQGTQKTPN